MEMEREYKLSAEVADEQMDRLMRSYDIDVKDVVVDQGPESIETIINRLKRAIRAGTIEVNDDGSVTHNLTVPMDETSSITYKRMNGKALKEGDKNRSANFDRQCAMMGSLANVPAASMAKMDIVDISVFQRLATLFLVA
jgi:hypothetical protein